MKTDLTTPALLSILALAVLVESPVVLGIFILGFCLDSALNQFMTATLAATSYLKDRQIGQLNDELEQSRVAIRRLYQLRRTDVTNGKPTHRSIDLPYGWLYTDIIATTPEVSTPAK